MKIILVRLAEVNSQYTVLKIICGSRNCGMADWEIVNLAFDKDCTAITFAKSLRHLANRIDRISKKADFAKPSNKRKVEE
jgi:hypothetical protein